MNQKEKEQYILDNYKKDENTMILVFSQWCVNNDLDPRELYKQAYPDQGKNQQLGEAFELTIPKNESDEIPVQTVLDVLQLFENDHLAFVVAEEYEKKLKE
ncbi:hypothetical protein NC797_11730 [Aquibacillus sp. 3ASR75-11]|uniref:Uncharacterized protein n=1 Tax=Terrihalobacillus insolitus TaxID=2950438 RepID=A0A9X3WUQ2_9BACI|nr:hypothetical protein [Terrihalobacillus insolitus]MDC3425173.1 hypothetical protein [Terrihalobacillus insolitus]